MRKLLFLLASAIFFLFSITNQSYAAITSITLNNPPDYAQTVNTVPSFTFTAVSNTSTTFSCTLYIDDAAHGTNTTVSNNTKTTIVSNTSLTSGDHSWYILCSDEESSLQSSTRTIGIGSSFSRCAVLIDSGDYSLTSSLSNRAGVYHISTSSGTAAGDSCITLKADNIRFSCNGNTISCRNSYDCEIAISVLSTNSEVYDCNIDTDGHGILIYSTSGVNITNISITSSSSVRENIHIEQAFDVRINSVNSTGGQYGIYVYNTKVCGNITVTNSIIKGASDNGAYINNPIIDNCGPTRVIMYNNIFNNTDNIYALNPQHLILNTTKQPGTNIVGYDYIGGNYWGKPDGTGYSDSCFDLDLDGICDEPYKISMNSEETFDYLPLTKWKFVSSCSAITDSGTHILTSNITDYSSNYCFNITANSAAIVCNGSKVDGVGAADSYAFYVKSSNVYVKGCEISDFTYGIYANGYSEINVEDITSNNNNYTVYLFSSPNSFVSGITSTSDVNVIFAHQADNSVFEDITITSCSPTDYSCVYIQNTTNATINGVKGSSSGLLIELYGTNQTKVYNVDVSNNIGDVIYFQGVALYGKGYNNVIENVTCKNNDRYCVYIKSESNCTLRNVYSYNDGSGPYINCKYADIYNLTSIDNPGYGIILYKSNHSTIRNSYIKSNDWGVFLYNSSYVTINSNIINISDDYVIRFEYSMEDSIYDNIFIWESSFSTDPFSIVGPDYVCYLNTTKQSGPNIKGGMYLGGNYWDYADGTGYSENCTDSDFDGLCDDPYQITSNKIDYLPIRKNVAPKINNITLNVPNLGSINDVILLIDSTDDDGNLDRRYVWFNTDYKYIHTTSNIISLNITDQSSNSGYVFVNDTFSAYDSKFINYSFTNNSYVEDNYPHDLSYQRIKKTDVIYNYGSGYLLYNITHYNRYGGNLVSGGSFTGHIYGVGSAVLETVWYGDWLSETISEESQDPSHTTIANGTAYTYRKIAVNNSGVFFTNVSVGTLCRTGWNQNITKVNISPGYNEIYVGCSKDNVITFTQSDVVFTGVTDIVVDKKVYGYIDLEITNNDDSIKFYDVYVEAQIPSFYTNESPYTFLVNLSPSETVTRRVNISGIPVVEKEKSVTRNTIPSYEKYTFTAVIEALDDAVSNYNIVYLIPKSFLPKIDNRTKDMDVYRVDGKSDGLTLTENDTHIILTVTTNFTQSSLHLGTHNVVFEYYIYDPSLVSAGGGGGFEVPSLSVSPEELVIDIIKPNICNETYINITWTGSPQEATILVSEYLKDVVVYPNSTDKIWLNRQTILPIKVCIPENMRQDVRLINLKSWSGYIEIIAQGHYGSISKRVMITVNYKKYYKLPKPRIGVEREVEVKPEVFIIFGAVLLLIVTFYDRLCAMLSYIKKKASVKKL